LHAFVEGLVRLVARLRAIVVGGARLEPALYEQAIALGWPCLPSYGLTETCSQVATASPASISAGRYPSALPILSHAVIRQGDDGRLWIQARSLLTCCAEISRGGARAWDPKRDGWLETEDLGHVSGRLVEVLGRASESVKVLGELVSLTALEERAWQWAEREQLRGPEGFDLAVVALPHERLGFELVLAIVDASVPASRRENLEASLMSFCREALLPFERIQRMARVEVIPRTPLGKVRRHELSALVTGQSRV
jgi:O-succinylbenzoic acid--CoA ligase